MSNVIHIFGASGSGTSTLGRKICAETGYTFMDTDDYYWLPTDPRYTVKRSCSERLKLMNQDIAEFKNVVISGSLVDWGDSLIPLFTLAIRLQTKTDVRIERLRARELAAFGNRVNPGGDMYEHHNEFIEWARSYDTGGIEIRSRAKHEEWEKSLLCTRLLLNGADDLDYNYGIVKNLL